MIFRNPQSQLVLRGRRLCACSRGWAHRAGMVTVFPFVAKGPLPLAPLPEEQKPLSEFLPPVDDIKEWARHIGVYRETDR